MFLDSYSDEIEEFCGSSGPNGVRGAVGGYVYISFSTDSSITRDGFRLIYRQVVDGMTSYKYLFKMFGSDGERGDNISSVHKR